MARYMKGDMERFEEKWGDDQGKGQKFEEGRTENEHYFTYGEGILIAFLNQLDENV